MRADEFLREGNPREALIQLQDQVRNNPANAEYRTFLFQLLSVLGDWERAMTQLSVVEELDPATLAMVQTYREALRCEVLRSDIFAGNRSPLLFGQPQEWVALLIEALRLAASGKIDESQEVRNKAFQTAPSTSGKVDGNPFEWLADADPRLGPVLEVIMNGQYFWVPIQQIYRIHIEEPADLRDTVWMPAYFTWSNGGETVGLIPTRYPGTENHENGQLMLSRKTEWLDHGSGFFTGLGQRMLATEVTDYPIMDIREIEFDTVAPEDINSGNSSPED
jgi:type VI secretion system protein ImpE